VPVHDASSVLQCHFVVVWLASSTVLSSAIHLSTTLLLLLAGTRCLHWSCTSLLLLCCRTAQPAIRAQMTMQTRQHAHRCAAACCNVECCCQHGSPMLRACDWCLLHYKEHGSYAYPVEPEA
jgi:hypothetical protein